MLDRPGLRPTPDRVRETLFNWLGQDLSGWQVLDAFAGSGVLGFEAASRGARCVVLLERDATLVAALESCRRRLGGVSMIIHRADALQWMACSSAVDGLRFDLVLLDPPYAMDLFAEALTQAAGVLANGGCLYLEADRAFDADDLAARGWMLSRYQRMGSVHAHLMVRKPASTDATAQSTHA